MVVSSSYDSSYLPVSLIKEWLWCPVMAWLEYLGLPEPLPNHALEPELRSPYEVAEELITYLGVEPKYVVIRPRLRSRRLGIVGNPDLIILYGSEALVAELKTTSSWVLNDHVRLQVCAYALLTKENYSVGSVRAFIISSLGYFEVDWVRELPKLLKVISELRRVLTNEVIPEPKHSGLRCRACPYFRVCRWGPNA